ncbi:MAG: tryptophan synthase subunit alpha [Ginsengibacter sp.]
MNQLGQLFAKKSKNILSIYFTAGYPELEDTTKIITSLIQNGADLIEIGMPYSDPLADGAVIQESGTKALENGMTIEKLFDQLKNFKNDYQSNCPLILMGYLNPVLQYGFEQFCKQAHDCGISGIILPDLPVQEYEKEFKEIIEKYALNFIFLVTPQTSESRIRKIDSLSNGFIYAVSSSSVTGSNVDFIQQEKYFQKLQAMDLKNKVLIGFGIRDRKSFEEACRYSAGAIIGSAFIKSLDQEKDLDNSVKDFLNSILQS